MIETLKTIVENYNAGLVLTPNIQVLEKKLANETIYFPSELIDEFTFVYSLFRNSELINMKFVNIIFESSYFEECLIENCIFKRIVFRQAQFDNCVFTNCQFLNCNLTDIDSTKTIFNGCRFLGSSFNSAIFDSCHFRKITFEDTSIALLGSAVLINSKFSNFTKSIELKNEVYFANIFEKVKKL